MAASLKQGKAVSVDKIPNEVLKNENFSEAITCFVYQLFFEWYNSR